MFSRKSLYYSEDDSDNDTTLYNKEDDIFFGKFISKDAQEEIEDIVDISETDLDLSKYKIYDSPRIKSYVSIHNYLLDVKRKGLICSMDTEWFVKKEPFNDTGGSEKNKEAEAYKIYTNNEFLKEIGTKLLLNNPRNRCEIRYYSYFSDLVLLNQTPHFPLVSVSQECKFCEACKGITLELEDSILIFSELAEGSASSYFPINMKGHKVKEMISMIYQSILACLTLENHQIVHGDLHFGNIIYHEQEENKGKYIHYILDSKDDDSKKYNIYVKHEGKLWVLWDFGNMTTNGEENPKHREINTDTLSIDINRLLHLSNTRLRKFNIDIFENITANNTFELIRVLSEMYSKLNSEDPKINKIKDMIIVSENEQVDIDTIGPSHHIKKRKDNTSICPFNIGIKKSKELTLEL